MAATFRYRSFPWVEELYSGRAVKRNPYRSRNLLASRRRQRDRDMRRQKVYLTVLRDYPTIVQETVLDGELAVPYTRNPL